MDRRKLNEYYERLAGEVIQENKELHFIKKMMIKIAYLESEDKKQTNGRTIFGQCEKVAEKNKWAIPYDFTITLFPKNLKGFDEDRLKILLHHELLHIGFPQGRLGIIPHDVEDFKRIIEKHGINWEV